MYKPVTINDNYHDDNTYLNNIHIISIMESCFNFTRRSIEVFIINIVTRVVTDCSVSQKWRHKLLQYVPPDALFTSQSVLLYYGQITSLQQYHRQ